MWEHALETTTDVPAERLWQVVTDLAGWADWYPEVDSVRPEAGMVLVREHGAWNRWTVDEADRPFRFTVSRPLWLGRVRTTFAFRPRGCSTAVHIRVQVRGLGRFLVRRAYYDRWTDGVPESFRRLVGRARAAGPLEAAGRQVLEV